MTASSSKECAATMTREIPGNSCRILVIAIVMSTVVGMFCFDWMYSNRIIQYYLCEFDSLVMASVGSAASAFATRMKESKDDERNGSGMFQV